MERDVAPDLTEWCPSSHFHYCQPIGSWVVNDQGGTAVQFTLQYSDEPEANVLYAAMKASCEVASSSIGELIKVG